MELDSARNRRSNSSDDIRRLRGFAGRGFFTSRNIFNGTWIPQSTSAVVKHCESKENSLKILNKISNHADILELGFPHNTPIADGGQIQGSSHRALKNGIKLKDVFQIVKKFKKKKSSKTNYSNGLFQLDLSKWRK